MSDSDTIDVVWSLREGAWFARGFGFPWRRVATAHLSAREGDEMLAAAVRPMFTQSRGTRIGIRRLEPSYRLPKP